MSTEPLSSAQISENMTIMQVPNPPSKPEAENNKTVAQFSSEDNSKNPNATEVNKVQNPTGQTIIQYSDSAIHNPAVQTIFQPMPSPSTESNQTIFQPMPKSPQLSTHTQLSHPPNIFQDIFRAPGSFTLHFIHTTGEFFHSIWSKINRKELQSHFHQNSQPPGTTFSEEQLTSSEVYQKKLRELDICRLSFAKELARNGKFRNAILIAEQISETSYFFKDAQVLIKSCKSF